MAPHHKRGRNQAGSVRLWVATIAHALPALVLLIQTIEHLH